MPLHHPITRAAYRALPGINQSALKHLSRSPLHFQHAQQHPEPPTPAMQLGAYYDYLLFGADTEVVVSPFDSFRTADAKLWRTTHEDLGHTIVTQEQAARANQMITAVRADPAAGPLLQHGQSSTAFTADLEGVPVKGLTDWLVDGLCLCLDLKVTTDASEPTWQRHLLKMQYDLQAAMYVHGLEAATHDGWSFGWIVVEDEPPHAVAVWIADPEILRHGRMVLIDRLRTWDRCMKSGVWPGYTPSPQRIGLPAYAAKALREDA